MAVSDEPLTLADQTLRTMFRARKGQRPPFYVSPALRFTLAAARRFVLDKSASMFLADLTYANWGVVPRPAYCRVLATSRPLARLPHKEVWIEIDAVALWQRAADLHPGGSPPPRDVPATGWLLRQHPSIETAFSATVIKLFAGGQILQQPYDIMWRTDDAPLPWKSAAADPYFKRVSIYQSEHIGITANDMTPFLDGFGVRAKGGLPAPTPEVGTAESLSVEPPLILTLLSTINDIPVGVREVKQSRGFVAQGRYRKFLDHCIVTIVLPKGRDPHKVARSIIAIARRRAHQVRGHWRRDWRHEGQRVWIREHQRGDASLGFVTHDYRVEHPAENPVIFSSAEFVRGFVPPDRGEG
jgi:hypothetical protein